MSVVCQPGYPALSALLSLRPVSTTIRPRDRVTALGRDAVYWAFRGLGLPPGTPAWMPSFHCGVEVQAALDAGFEAAYYRIAPDLTADTQDLGEGLRRRPGPVLLIHYFGFPQPQTHRVLERCREWGVPLIEDCCHALFSRWGDEELGSIGHAAAFSVRKCLGTVDGGILRVNVPPEAAGQWRSQLLHQGPRARWPYRALLRRVLRVDTLPLPGALDAWLCAGVPDPDLCSGRAAHRGSSRSDRSSWLGERVLRITRPEEVVRRRRANWALLHARLKGLPAYHPVHQELPPGTSPLGLVVASDRRAALARALRARGIEPYIFGASPHPTLDRARSADAERLREDLFCLPVHHALTGGQLERLAAALSDELGAPGPRAPSHGAER